MGIYMRVLSESFPMNTNMIRCVVFNFFASLLSEKCGSEEIFRSMTDALHPERSNFKSEMKNKINMKIK